MMHDESIVDIARRLAAAGNILACWIEDDDDAGTAPNQHDVDVAIADSNHAVIDIEIWLRLAEGQQSLGFGSGARTA